MNEDPTATGVDEAVLGRLARQGDAEYLAQLVGVFVERAASGTARALAAAAEHSLDEVRLAAQSLVFTAASVGARRLQRAAEAIEQLAMAQDSRALQRALRELDAASAEARSFVAAWHVGYAAASQPRSATPARPAGPGGSTTPRRSRSTRP